MADLIAFIEGSRRSNLYLRSLNAETLEPAPLSLGGQVGLYERWQAETGETNVGSEELLAAGLATAVSGKKIGERMQAMAEWLDLNKPTLDQQVALYPFAVNLVRMPQENNKK